jgi:hypothetical protein
MTVQELMNKLEQLDADLLPVHVVHSDPRWEVVDITDIYVSEQKNCVIIEVEQ